VLTTVAQACRNDERLALGYTAADGTASQRTVDPHRLVSLGRRWYFVAYDLDRHTGAASGWTGSAVQREGSRFRPRELPAKDAAAFVRVPFTARLLTAQPAGDARGKSSG